MKAAAKKPETMQNYVFTDVGTLLSGFTNDFGKKSLTNAVNHYQFRTDAADNVARGESVQNPLNKNEEGTGIPKDYQTTIDKQASALREKDRESEPSEVTEINMLQSLQPDGKMYGISVKIKLRD